MLHDLIVDLNNFEIIKSLGEGSYGRVYLIKHKRTNKQYSAKISKYKLKEIDKQKSFYQELEALSKVKHPAILSLYGFNMTDFKKDNFPTIITDYMPNGSLDQLLADEIHLTPTNKYIILYGIAEGMNYLHSKKIIHRDLKPGNILLDEHLYPHICDFGQSKISELSVSSLFTESYSGTPLYMAPEIFLEEPYTYKVDVYSFSILAYQLITEKSPYTGFRTIFMLHKSIKSGKRPDLSIIKNDYIKSLLIKWWSPDPNERPAFKTIVKNIKSDEFQNAFEIKKNNDDINNYFNLFHEELPSIDLKHDSKLRIDEGKTKSRPELIQLKNKSTKSDSNEKCSSEINKKSSKNN